MMEIDWSHLTHDSQFAPLRGAPMLVTGGAGFIGSHLVDALLALGGHVVVLDNLSTGRLDNLRHHLDEKKRHTISRYLLGDGRPIVTNGSGKPLTLVVGDIRNESHCRTAFEILAGLSPKTARQPAFVFHQAALGSVPRSFACPGETLDVNVAGTARVLQAARDAKVKRVVFASSSSVYGDSPHLPKKEGEEGLPLSPYALSKVMNEQLAHLFTRCFQMELVGLRYFNVYGPRQDPTGPYAAVIPRFVQAYLHGTPPTIYGDGQQTRDFTYVADAVRANLLAAVAPRDACGQAYNVAPGVATSILELARLVRELVGAGADPRHEPPRPGDVRHSLAHTTKARDALGFVASTGLRAGLEATLRCFWQS